jgi:hypothetical protein
MFQETQVICKKKKFILFVITRDCIWISPRFTVKNKRQVIYEQTLHLQKVMFLKFEFKKNWTTNTTKKFFQDSNLQQQENLTLG